MTFSQTKNFMLNDFEWDKKANVIRICSDKFSFDEWQYYIVKGQPLHVESHVTGKVIRYLYEETIDEESFSIDVAKRWVKIIFRPVDDKYDTGSIPDIEIYPPAIN